MHKSFSLRQALTILVLVCLMSVVTGAVLAQAEPELPDDGPIVVPAAEEASGLAAQAAGPEVPVEPEIPLIVVEPVAAPPTNAPTGLVPGDGSVVTTPRPTISWSDAPNGAVSEFELYFGSQIGPDGNPLPGQNPAASVIVDNNGDAANDPLSPTSPTSPTVASPMVFEIPAVDIPGDNPLYPGDLTNGMTYFWRVRFLNADGAGPWATASFIVDFPEISPADGGTVITTTPLITHPDLAADYYHFVSYIPADDIVGWIGSYAEAEICENEQCKLRPETELTVDLFDGNIAVGDTEVQIYYATSASADLPVTGWAVLTTFTIAAPDMMADTTDAGDGRPTYMIDRDGQVVDEILPASVDLLGMTQTIYPDYYEIFVLDGDFNLVANEWYRVAHTAGDPATTPCVDMMGNPSTCTHLVPVDGLDPMLFNNGDINVFGSSLDIVPGDSYLYVVRGYSTALDGYTPYALGANTNFSFVIDELPPSADSLLLAGTYESLGSGPYAMTSTWMACGADGCDSGAPYVHIAKDLAGPSGDYIGIVLINDATFEIEYFNYLDVNQSLFPASDGRGEYWQCGVGFGAGAFTGTTCFFSPGLDSSYGGLEPGSSYTWYVGSFGPGGTSTGGFADIGFVTDSFETVALSGVSGLMVDVEGLTGTSVTGMDLPGFTETTISGDPVISWDDVPAPAFYGVQVTAVGNVDVLGSPYFLDGQIVYGGDYDSNGTLDGHAWFAYGDSSGPMCYWGGTCVFSPDIFWLPAGTYEAEVIYYDGSVSEAVTYQFTYAPEEPVAPMTSTMRVYDGEELEGTLFPIFEWPHSQGNELYLLEVFEQGGTVDLLGGAGLFADSDICYIDLAGFDEFGMPYYGTFCSVNLLDLITSSGTVLFAGDYEWRVIAVGSGGTTIETILDISPLASFSIVDTSVSDPVALWPASGDSLTHTNVPTFYWEASDNASWYRFVLAEFVSAGPGTPETYNLVFDNFVYRPLANDAPSEDIGPYPINGVNVCRSGYSDLFDANGMTVTTVDPSTVVCSYSWTPFDGGLTAYDSSLPNNGEYVMFAAALGPSDSSSLTSFTDFTLDLPESAPVWHGGFMSDPMTGAWQGMFGYGEPFAMPLDGSVFSDLNAVGFYRPASDEFGTETLVYQLELVDTATDMNIPVTGPDILSIGNFGYVFPEDVNCGAGNSSFCYVQLDEGLMSAYGVYELQVGTIGIGNIDWTAFELISISVPASDGSQGPSVAKFTKL